MNELGKQWWRKTGGPGPEPNSRRWFAYKSGKTGPARLVFHPYPPPSRMDTQNPSPTPDSDSKATATPNYGEFGHAADNGPANATPGRSGANDNPDEFAEFGDREQEAQKAPDNPEDQPGHIEQNQNPAAVRQAQGKDNEDQRAAWADDDPRYAGGGTHNTREEAADAKYPDTDE